MEVSREQGFTAVLESKANLKSSTSNVLHVTRDAANLPKCNHMLLYLTRQTWTRGEASVKLGDEVMRAMDLEVSILLVHEMPGSGGQDARFSCEFGAFFSCPDGATPSDLVQRGIYSSIAVPLKGGAWREASMVLLGAALGMSQEEVKEAQTDVGSSIELKELSREVASRLCASTTRAFSKRSDPKAVAVTNVAVTSFHL